MAWIKLPHKGRCDWEWKPYKEPILPPMHTPNEGDPLWQHNDIYTEEPDEEVGAVKDQSEGMSIRQELDLIKKELALRSLGAGGQAEMRKGVKKSGGGELY